MSNPTAAQRRRFEKIASFGCIICGSPAELHHCRHECGMSQRNHDHVAPLCDWHHRHSVLSRHSNPKDFAQMYGDDRELTEKTKRLLGEI